MDHHVHSFQCHFGCCFVYAFLKSRMPYALPKIQPPNAIRLRLPAGRLQQHRCGRPFIPLVDHVPKKTMLFDIYSYLLPEGQTTNIKPITLLRVIPTMTFIHFGTGKSSGILSDISSGILSGISSGILSGR